MLVQYKNDKERQFYESYNALLAAFNKSMASKIVQRIGELVAADNAQQLPRSARFHEHKGKRKGLYSLDLVHPFRLIVLPICNYTVWTEINEVQIYEIFNPH